MKTSVTHIESDIAYCLEALPKVSRTFAPTIRLLPKGLELPVTVAYLLCRVADTVEDSASLTVEEKKQMLELYAKMFTKERPEFRHRFYEQIGNLPAQTEDEKLVHQLPVILNVFDSFSDSMRHYISKWVAEMSLGMRKYAQSARKRTFTFLKSMKDLDEYTYFVAGTVGYLLTELFSYYSRKITPPIKNKLESLAESFGKGLQLVNIIRDMAVDLKRGQSYIPDDLLNKYRLTRETIFHKENADRAQQLFNELIMTAVNHLDKALDYVLLLPKEEKQIRLFCLLPLFWAMRTLQKIQENTLALLGNEKIKISRHVIRMEYFLAFITMRSNRLTRRHYQKIRSELLLPAG